MATREERLAANEVRFREINESAQPQRESQGSGRFVCECADKSCMAWLAVPPDTYVEVRSNPLWFVVLPGHEIPDVERIVTRDEGYFVIEKPRSVAHIVGA
jgi:hypothetical protein